MMDDKNEATDDVKVFVGDDSGPNEYACFFEDDGVTGYLYLSDRSKGEIIKHLQIYANSAQLNVTENDVRVVWSRDGSKCGVRIWGEMRGIIDIRNGVEGRAFLENRSSPPIRDRDWLNGFD
jgi:hypothetical protein